MKANSFAASTEAESICILVRISSDHIITKITQALSFYFIPQFTKTIYKLRASKVLMA